MAKKEKGRTDFKTVLRSIRGGLKAVDEETGEPIYSKTDLDNHIEKKGWTQEQFKTAWVNHASIQVRKSNPESVWGVAKGYLREVADGITIGFSDTVDKYLTGMINNDGLLLPRNDELEYTEQLIAEERADYNEKNPVLSTVGNMAGAMTTGGALTGGALKMLPKLAPSAQGKTLQLMSLLEWGKRPCMLIIKVGKLMLILLSTRLLMESEEPYYQDHWLKEQNLLET
jgi:hypothetical protein